MKQEKNSLTHARSINSRSLTKQTLKAHELMAEILELADNETEDLELLKIKIAVRQRMVEQLLETEEKPQEQKATSIEIWEKLATADWSAAMPRCTDEERIAGANDMIQRMIQVNDVRRMFQ